MSGRARWLRAAALVGLAAGLTLPGSPLPAVASSTGASSSATARSWITFGGDAGRTGANDDERVVTRATVGRLKLAWSRSMRGPTIAQPVVAAGLVVGGEPTDVAYVASERGWLSALRTSDGSVLWRRYLGAQHTRCSDVPNGVFGVSGSPYLDIPNGRLFAAGGDGKLHALALATGEELPGWPVVITNAPERNHVYGSVNVWDGRVYLATASFCDFTPYHGRVIAFDDATGALLASWYPIGRKGKSGGGIWGLGGAAIDESTGDVFTATGNALTTPEFYRHAEEVVRLDAGLRVVAHDYPKHLVDYDDDFGATPLLFRAPGCPPQLTVKKKSGQLFLYDLDGIDDGYRQVLQVASSRDWQFNGIPAYDPATNMVYVSNSTDSNFGRFVHGMVALSVTADCRLWLAWQRRAGPGRISVSPPTVAGGVVYFGDGTGRSVHAFDAQTGERLWTRARPSADRCSRRRRS